MFGKVNTEESEFNFIFKKRKERDHGVQRHCLRPLQHAFVMGIFGGRSYDRMFSLFVSLSFVNSLLSYGDSRTDPSPFNQKKFFCPCYTVILEWNTSFAFFNIAM